MPQTAHKEAQDRLYEVSLVTFTKNLLKILCSFFEHFGLTFRLKTVIRVRGV